MYLVSTAQQQVIKRSLVSPQHSVLQTIDATSGLGVNPQSVVVAANGDVIVGHKGGFIRQYDKTGTPLPPPLNDLNVTVDTNDSLWLDLAADQQTIFYTSGGRTIRTIKRNGTGAGQFGPALPGNSSSDKAGAIRLLAPLSGTGNDFTFGIRGAIVADGLTIHRVNSSGAVVKTYDFGSGNNNLNTWVALGIDPKDVDEFGANRAFWAGDFATGNVFRFNVETAAVEVGPVTTGVTNALSGICLNGEPTVGQFTGLLNLTHSHEPHTERHGVLRDRHTGRAGTTFLRPCVRHPLQSSPVNIAVNAREVISDGVVHGRSDEYHRR